MGLGGCYTGTNSEVKVGEEHSKPFRVACGLRQGCILSPLLFSLYINSLISKLKEIFAEDEELMRRGLDVLAEWCEEWSVKVNVEKCRVMHVRIKERCEEI